MGRMISHKLSALKSVLWRIMGVFILGAVTYYFTRHWITTTYITVVHHATFLIVFYLHERFWHWVKKPAHPIKAITYEIILGMGLGGLVVFLFTSQWSKVTQITLTYTAIKLVMYYIWDKIWFNRIEK